MSVGGLIIPPVRAISPSQARRSPPERIGFDLELPGVGHQYTSAEIAPWAAWRRAVGDVEEYVIQGDTSCVALS